MLPNPTPQSKSRARQSFVQEEKARQIDRENQQLFQRILGTMKQRNRSTTPIKNTLNYKNRKDFQQKIMDENQKLFSRIKQQTSYYKRQKSQPKQLSKQRANSSYLSSKKIQELYQSKLVQGDQVYKIRIIIDGQLFKIMAITEEQSYMRVLEMMKSDGVLLLKNVFQNNFQNLIQNLQISNKITIKGIELVETHGNFG